MSDTLPLPPRPNLNQYKKAARDFQRACKSSDSAAVRDWATRWAETIARLQGLEITSEVRREINQRAERIAQRWHTIKSTDKNAARCTLAKAQFFIAREHGFDSWATFARSIEVLTRVDSLVSKFETAADAIVSGDTATLSELLTENPELVKTRSTREHHSTLLHYVSANGIEDFRQKTPKNIIEITELVLEAGADVNAESDAYGGGSTTLGLAATSIHPERAGVLIGLLETLLDHGATIDARGRSDVLSCLRNDRPKGAAFLATRGARLDFEGAAGVGRLDLVESFFNKDGSLKPNVSERQLEAGFRWACEYGHINVVEFLLKKSMNLRAGENTGQTALHLAAHRGQLDIIKLLLGLGAPLEAKNVYGGTVLGQATWSVMHGDPGIDFVPVIQTLLDAGADVREADYPTGNLRVDELLGNALSQV